MRKTWASLAVALPCLCHAQQVVQADVAHSQAQIRRDEKGFSACGVRAIVSTMHGDKTRIYDFSLMTYAENLRGLTKIGMAEISTKDMTAGTSKFKATFPGPTAYWFAQPLNENAVRPVLISPSEDKGFVIGISDISETMKVAFSIAMGEIVQFSAVFAKDRFNFVYQFKAPLSADEKSSFLACYDGMAKRIQRNIDE